MRGKRFTCISKDIGAVPGQVSKIFEKNVHVVDPENKKVIHGKRRFISVAFSDMEEKVHDRLIQHIYTGNYDNATDPSQHKGIIKGIMRRMFGDHEKIYQAHDG